MLAIVERNPAISASGAPSVRVKTSLELCNVRLTRGKAARLVSCDAFLFAVNGSACRGGAKTLDGMESPLLGHEEVRYTTVSIRLLGV